MVLQRRQLVVKVVVIEGFLHFFVVQASLVLFECVVVCVFPLFVYVFFIKVVRFWRDERTFHTTILQGFEGKVSQPNMILYLSDPIGSQSVLRFPLDHLQRHSYICVGLPGL